MTFIETIKKASADLAKLRIRTMIGSFQVDENDKIKDLDLSDEKNQAMESQVDLIDGDITTAMSSKFVSDEEYVKLRTFHLQREQAGHEIIRKNIEAIKEIINMLVVAKKEEKNIL